MIKKNLIINAPKPVGNYTHSIEVNGLLYLSGVGPRNSNDNSIPGNKYDEYGDLLDYDIKQQTHAVIDNVKTILHGSNSSWSNLIDITVFLTNMKRAKQFPCWAKTMFFAWQNNCFRYSAGTISFLLGAKIQ